MRIQKQIDRSWTEINLKNFSDNLQALKSFLPANSGFIQIVKADAYGHGAFEISKKAIELGAAFLGVANIQEAILLRYQNIQIPILILSPSLESEIQSIIDYDIIPSVSSIKFIQELDNIAQKIDKKIKIHINIDTGMGRSGFDYKSALKNILKIKMMKNTKIDGIFSHFAASENDFDFSKIQQQRFQQIIDQLDFQPSYVHISNSSGVVNINDDFTNLARFGLLSYGVYASEEQRKKIKLKPVMDFKTRISQIKSASKGDSIGYNRTFIAQADLKYAILPVGYADGYDFLLSNKGCVLLNDSICKVIGKISMDITAIDISYISNVKIGDEVILLGNGNEKISAENVASLYNGSAYEILCQIGRRAKRYFKENGNIISTSPLLRREFVSLDYSDKKLNNIIESAIRQRLQSNEIATIVYENVLKHLFIEKDRDIHYRENFFHSIKFHDFDENYYLVETTLSFNKKLLADYFIVACAQNEEVLETYFMRKDVEYRWLLDDNLMMNKNYFEVISVKINDIELEHKTSILKSCIEIRCHSERLQELISSKVTYSISTKTFYSKKSHQMTVFLTEMTKDVQINFDFGNIINNVEAVPIFSGKMKYPEIEYLNGMVKVSSQKNEWIFPNSGVVFVY
ncbi:MAG: alanine racemase [Candidatus Cloacimonetes bacterium]|nr:alanine racemase [Candidatus Cloacimonadota bacterium]